MFKFLFKNIFGSLTDIINKKQELKRLKVQNEISIAKAQTNSTIKILEKQSNTDLDIDFVNQQDKKYTIKDDVLTYLFLIPVFSASFVPFFTAFSDTGTFSNLNLYINESYQSLNLLPTWYKIVVFLIVIDVLGFRSLARPLVKKLTNKYLNKI